MEFLFVAFMIFVAICIMAAFWVGLAMVVIGTIYLLVKLVFWLAYLGVIFIILGVVGLLIAKLWDGIRNYFS